MIQVTDHDGVLVITLNRPEKRNAMTPESLADLGRAIPGHFDPHQCRAIMLAGNGPVFCGGFDLRLCLDQPGTMRRLLTGLADVIRRLNWIPIPVVMAAHGAAIAGGCALLGAADAVITNDDAKLGYPVVRLGVSPAISAPVLRQRVGDGFTRQRMVDVELVGGKEAVRIGLATESLARAEDVLPRAMEVARHLAAKPPHAFAATKSWLEEIAQADAFSRGFTSSHQESERALHASLSIEGSTEQHERLTELFSKPAR